VAPQRQGGYGDVTMDAPETFLRLGLFAMGLTGLGLAEAIWPGGRASGWTGGTRARRWLENGALSLLSALGVRLMGPVSTLGAALFAQAHGLGILPALGLAPWAVAVLAVLLLDLTVYGQHVALHRLAWGWRLHRVHHLDPGMDVSTGIRFHPGEAVLSALVKSAAVLALGAPPEAVLIFDILLNLTALFSHADISLPAKADLALRRVIVTPGMHAIHHAQIRADHDSNYGFCLSLWDRLFSTYRARAQDPFARCGLARPGADAPLGPLALLAEPFAREGGR